MGMFDSLYDAEGNEWQTKAFGRTLHRYEVGDEITKAPPIAYQIIVLGPCASDDSDYAWATIRDGRIEAVPVERDLTLPHTNYSGDWITTTDAPSVSGNQENTL